MSWGSGGERADSALDSVMSPRAGTGFPHPTGRSPLAPIAPVLDNEPVDTPPSLLRPHALRPGARVALVAPGGPVEPERVDRSAERCRGLRLEPVVFPAATARHRRLDYLAGTDEARLTDLQGAFDDPAIDGVWALRGGYGTQRIVDHLDLARQRRAPIPFIGFSDNTTLHARHAALGVISFHGPHPGGNFPPETEQSFYSVLFAAEAPGILPTRTDDPPPRPLLPGAVEAPLAGGNLSMLASLCGTPDSVTARDRILFVEDVGEPAYRVDRMLLQLRRAGVLEGVAGLALGRFTGDGNNGRAGEDDGGTHLVPDVLEELAADLGVPTVADLPFGHVEHNCTLPVGARALLDADAGTLVLTEPAVERP